MARRCGVGARLWRMPSIIEAWLPRVRQDDAARHARRQRAERRPVGDVAGGEQQRGFLAVQVGELLLQQHVIVVGARDVAGAAGAGAAAVERLVHRLEHLRMLAHAEIVVRAPDRDLAGAVGAVMGGAREVRRPGARDRRRRGSGLPRGGRRAARGRRLRSSWSSSRWPSPTARSMQRPSSGERSCALSGNSGETVFSAAAPVACEGPVMRGCVAGRRRPARSVLGAAFRSRGVAPAGPERSSPTARCAGQGQHHEPVLERRPSASSVATQRQRRRRRMAVGRHRRRCDHQHAERRSRAVTETGKSRFIGLRAKIASPGSAGAPAGTRRSGSARRETG